MKRWSRYEPVARLLLGVLMFAPNAVLAGGLSAAPGTADGAKTITVAADGSGQYKTVQEAVNAAPDNSAVPFVIHIKAGKYEDNVTIPKNKPNITLQGEGAEKTLLSWNRSVYDPKPEGAHSFNPGLFVAANDFRATNLTIENTAGDRGQALAAVVDGDRVMFENCRLLGWQDTLMVNNGRQYFRDCYIEGRVDFIYGSGTSLFDHCELHSKNGGYVTAANTPQEKPFGFVFLNCKLTGDPNPWIDPATGTAKNKPGALALLGRPWRAYASVAFINCQMGDHIRPEGWSNWSNVENEKTARYAEYNTQTLDGKPLDVSKRLPWTKQLTAQEAAQYTITNVLGGTGPEQPFGDAAAKPIKIVRTAPPGVLLAQNATINGTNARLENDGANIGYWTNTDTRFTWPANVPLGTYRVALVYALDPADAGSDLQISVGDQNFELKPPATGGWSDYKTLEVGQAEIGKSNTSLTLNATSKKGNFILNLRQVTLTAANATGGQTPTGAVAEVVKPAQYKVRIVLGGDSTVTDGAGWGAGFKKRLKPEVELINLSKGGRASGSFIQEGRWKQTLDLKPDYVLVQFGHNDQHGHGPERETDPQTTYKANMERYVDEARAAGIKPILVTPVSRRQWGPNGKINSGLTPYAEAVKQIAAEKKVPLIDLHALSIALYEKMGEKAVQEISPIKTGGGFDGTHFNEKGGEIVGKIVADALREAVPALAPYINP
jgi:pectinesterase